jgi:hypothetical protein
MESPAEVAVAEAAVDAPEASPDGAPEGNGQVA